MCDLNCPEGILWTNQTCNPHLFVCTCMQSESPVPCMVHASRTHSVYFITLQTIEALVFVAILILLVILLYLHNQNKQKRLTVLNLQLLSLTGLQVGKYLFCLVHFHLKNFSQFMFFAWYLRRMGAVRPTKSNRQRCVVSSGSVGPN